MPKTDAKKGNKQLLKARQKAYNKKKRNPEGEKAFRAFNDCLKKDNKKLFKERQAEADKKYEGLPSLAKKRSRAKDKIS